MMLAGAPGGGTAWLDAAEVLGARSSHGGGAPDLPVTDVARGGSSRGAGELIKSAPAEKHLLILLTDASPDDSHKILPSGKVPLSRDYDGQIGVDDTAEEVRALRAQGIRVAAVFMGENASVPAANAIYGRDLARIRRIDQLAATAGRLIQDEIRELSS